MQGLDLGEQRLRDIDFLQEFAGCFPHNNPFTKSFLKYLLGIYCAMTLL